MTRRRSLVALLAAALCLAPGVAQADGPVPAASTTSAPAALRARFEGTFLFEGGDSERRGVNRAIERAIDGMFFIAKPIARGRLRDKNHVLGFVGFHFHGGLLTATAPLAPPIVSREDGTPVSYTTHGETMRVGQRLTPAGHLVEVFTTGDGSRTNDFYFTPDGATLMLRVTVSSARLPRDVRYLLTYRMR